MSGPRRTMLETLLDACRATRSGAYYVKRGAIVWEGFDFESHAQKRAIAIMCDEGQLLRDQFGMYTESVTLEMAAQMSLVETEPAAGIDDAIEEEMIEDARVIVRALIEASSGGDPVVFKVGNEAPFVEWHDVELRVQGIIVYLKLTY